MTSTIGLMPTKSPSIQLATPESTKTCEKILLTPNTRQKKHQLAKSLSEMVKEWSIRTNDQNDVIDLALCANIQEILCANIQEILCANIQEISCANIQEILCANK